ncbi:delta(3 5) delta(2 4)-dienoyl-CoA isomerase 1 [Striga asiatica]|uniref:Delta(3 5) delta(2 4)-dienoyl-CoA isomerase 1 n=1 Tax=Striga asiatica TaxID=4170 RepID=A0A5A7QYP2_STRAF|nr:delta(3 5) delta(2 4)-dienoyl-CoA isomerase 1 [Striga asiatica]
MSEKEEKKNTATLQDPQILPKSNLKFVKTTLRFKSLLHLLIFFPSHHSSSITAANFLSSSQSSSDSSPARPFMAARGASAHRCHGLDLLEKAIHQVDAGSGVGVPYIQHRVTIRRRRRLRWDLEFGVLFLVKFFSIKGNGLIS